MQWTRSDSDDLRDLPVWARGEHGLHLAEVPTHPGGRLPTFFVVGAPKCGTSALNLLLDRHPDVAMCPYKEPHFFSTDALYERGLPWYRGLFADCARALACGEASTSYTRAPDFGKTAARIHAAVPDARLIYLVREPIARTEADLLQGVKYSRGVLGEANERIDVDALLERHPVVLRSSEYIVQIRAYLEFFRRDQLLVLLQDDLRDDPSRTLGRIFRFIGVDTPRHEEAQAEVRVNRTDAFLDGVRTQRMLAVFRQVPGYSWLKDLLPPGVKARVKALGRSLAPEDGLSFGAETRARLQAHFRPFNAELAAFLDRDLSAWDA